MPIDDFLRRFRWTADRFDGWRVLDEPIGPLKGDCDDFAITVLWIMAGRSWLRVWWHMITGKAAIWYCVTGRGEGHAVLWLKGHGWVDNMYPDWSSVARHKRLFPWPFPMVAIKLLIGKLTS